MLALQKIGCSFFLACAITASIANAQTPGEPVALTAEQDHQRMMDLLHITALRPGADGNNAAAPNAANYDEARANPDPDLPDPLRLNNGLAVKSATQWWHARRPQIVADFDREIYGRVPAKLPAVRWELLGATAERIGRYPVIDEHVVGHVDNASDPAIGVDIQFHVITPAKAKSPVPVIVELAFTGKFARMPSPVPGPDWREQILALGWGYAELIPTSIQPDNGAGLTQGIIGLANKGRPRKPDQWGALRAWAWGASRAVDYLQSDRLVDGSQIGIMGHSRYGKAALVAMAYDPRIAIGYISSSGAGGANLWRRNFGEKLENVAGTGEYHWMAGNFLKYAGPLTAKDLPVDAHELIALCAPRPVFIGGGLDGDRWVDAHGMFMAAVAAGPVYTLLGKRDLGTTVYPPVGTALISGEIGFRQHPYGHTPTPNWPTFLTFAQHTIHAR